MIDRSTIAKLRMLLIKNRMGGESEQNDLLDAIYPNVEELLALADAALDIQTKGNIMPFEAQGFAEAAVENFLSGERFHQHVIDQLNHLTKNQAMAAAVSVMEILMTENRPLAMRFRVLLLKQAPPT